MHILLLGQEILSLSILLALGNHFQDIINKWHLKCAQYLISISNEIQILWQIPKGFKHGNSLTTFKLPRYQLNRRC